MMYARTSGRSPRNLMRKTNSLNWSTPSPLKSTSCIFFLMYDLLAVMLSCHTRHKRDKRYQTTTNERTKDKEKRVDERRKLEFQHSIFCTNHTTP